MVTTWRELIEQKYALICKGCSRKVIDPDKKNNQQVYTKNKCPHCNSTKDQIKKDPEPRKRLRVAC
jgi:DNA-directed RNA polymerase subunit RPC12/RpoP